MFYLWTCFRYALQKMEYSLSLSLKRYTIGQINDKQIGNHVFKNLLQGKVTYVHWNKGEEMSPTIRGQEKALLVRKLPTPDPTLFCRDRSGIAFRRVFVGDVVVLRDPDNSDNYLVRRLAAVEGYEMVSKDENDTPFILDMDQCWVVSDNKSLKPKEARDSRTFGPVPITDIVGRVIYCLRTAVDHGPIQNSHAGMWDDSPVLAVELDVDEMARSPKT